MTDAYSREAVEPTAHSAKLLLIFATLVLLSRTATAQFPALAPNRFSEYSSNNDPLRRLPRDPLVENSLNDAIQRIDSGDVTGGLTLLQEILNVEGDFLLRDGPQITGSLLEEIRWVLRDHFQEYQRIYGTQAQGMLEAAAESQDPAALEEILRRYEMTAAGAKALEQYAQICADAGDLASAARQWERLATHPAEANPGEAIRMAFDSLQKSGSTAAALELFERNDDQLPPETDVQSWLSRTPDANNDSASDALLYEWHSPFGGAAGSGRVSFAPAVADDAWEAPLVNEFDFPTVWVNQKLTDTLVESTRSLVDSMEKRLRSDSERAGFPAVRPLIVGDQVVVMGPGSVKAFNLQTGELEWNSVTVDGAFQFLTANSYSPGGPDDTLRTEMLELMSLLRGWRDLTATSLSTDGGRVYCVTECQLIGTTTPQRVLQNFQRHDLLPQRSNQLLAFDLATDGKLIWPVRSVDALSVFNEATEIPREIFYFGAPLPVNDRLYVLGEERGQVQLMEIDPVTGAVLWTIGLLHPDEDLLIDDARRISGLMPAYAGGLLICPTGEGVIAAVDPVRREVVWSHQYARSDAERQMQVLLNRMQRAQNSRVRESIDELISDRHWMDHRVIVAADKVLHTPPDQDRLVCVKLSDGTAAWEFPFRRGDLCYAAGTYGDSVLLVGKSEVSAIALEDGSTQWSEMLFQAAPAGRGVRMGDQFLQPLTDGSLAVVDLKQHRLLAQLPLVSGAIPGNLVAADGMIISATGDELRAFRSLNRLQQDIAQMQHVNVDDPTALAWQGELKLQQGQFNRGLKLLRDAQAQQPQPRTESVLASVLLSGLKYDFATYRSDAETIEQTLDSPDQRAQFLRVLSTQYRRAGEIDLALDRYLELLRSPRREKLRPISHALSVVDSRWAMAQISTLLTERRIDAATLRRRVGEWLTTADAKSLQNVLPALPADWVPPEQMLASVRELLANADALTDCEAALAPLLEESEPAIRAQTMQILADASARLHDPEKLTHWLATLEQEFPEERLPGGVTAAAWVAAARENPDWKPVLNSLPVWPQAAHAVDKHGNVSRTYSFQIPLLGPASPELNGWTFFLDQTANLDIYDAQGRHRSRINSGLTSVQNLMGPMMVRHVATHGRLALFVLIDRFFILEIPPDPEPVRMTAKGDLISRQDIYRLAGDLREVEEIREIHYQFSPSQALGSVGPLTDSLVCYQLDDTVIALNPRNGKELWRHKDLPPSCEILGDEQVVLLRPPHADEFFVLSGFDGREIARTPVPSGFLRAGERHHGDWGRLLPAREEHAGTMTWKMMDPVTAAPVWSFTGPVETRWTCVNGDDVAFLQPDGTCSIRDGISGALLSELSLSELPESLDEFSMIEFPDQWLIVLNPRAPRLGFYQLGQDRVLQLVRGTILAIDRTSREELWRHDARGVNLLNWMPNAWPVVPLLPTGTNSELVILERQTGTEVFRDDVVDDSTGVTWRGDPRTYEMQFRIGRDTVTLHCTPAEKVNPPAPQQE